MMRTLWLASIGFCVGMGSVACGGAPPPAREPAPAEEPRPLGPVEARGATEVRARVGPAGGTLHLGNGARLEIERGALTEEVEILFKEGADGRAFEDGAHQRPLGPMLAIEPPLLGRFVISVPEQSIPSGFDLEDLALGMEEADQQRAFGSGTQTRWQFYRASIDGGRLVARVEAVAGHRVRFGVAR